MSEAAGAQLRDLAAILPEWMFLPIGRAVWDELGFQRAMEYTFQSDMTEGFA
jgi:hypothetical protein